MLRANNLTETPYFFCVCAGRERCTSGEDVGIVVREPVVRREPNKTQATAMLFHDCCVRKLDGL